MKKLFQEVYPFTTEYISGEFEEIDFKGKKVLTLGSSSDQAYNAILLGAGKVTVYDISENVLTFGKIKKDIITTTSRKKLYSRVTNVKEVPLSGDLFSEKDLRQMNPYMSSEENYKRLQELLLANPDIIDYRVGDITRLDLDEDDKYDVILLSNALQYLDLFIDKDKDPYEELRRIFNELKIHLSEEGFLQLLYIYSIGKNNFTKSTVMGSTQSIVNVVNALRPNILSMSHFTNKSTNQEDAIIYYKR